MSAVVGSCLVLDMMKAFDSHPVAKTQEEKVGSEL